MTTIGGQADAGNPQMRLTGFVSDPRFARRNVRQNETV
jgi:hypothetical protein